jgi:hypothetical protein
MQDTSILFDVSKLIDVFAELMIPWQAKAALAGCECPLWVENGRSDFVCMQPRHSFCVTVTAAFVSAMTARAKA